MTLAKEGIAVYDPTDATESAIQEVSHKYLGEWLNSSDCQLVARAINSLKVFDDWLENAVLLEQRISYFFAPYMASHKNHMVFVTHKLYLRDIIENQEINLYNHDPIVLVTTPIAHYLLREYPIHIHLDIDKLKSLNYRERWLEVGGLIISDDKSIQVDESAILSIRDADDPGLEKAAASVVGPEVYKIDEHESSLEPDAEVWDKRSRESVTVVEVEPGETGVITVRYINGTTKSIPKTDFDVSFTRVGPQSGNETFDAGYNEGMEILEND